VKNGLYVPCVASMSSQQFILKEYLSRKQPDLVVVFGNAHDRQRFTLREYAMHLETFAEMADMYLPQSTRVVWTTKHARNVAKLPTVR
jgi:hypothetical protein